MKSRILYILSAFVFLFSIHVLPQPKDSERLGMALEYFSNGKYHEALLLLEDIDKHYELNPRFHAYMGLCYYYEWNYEKACAYLDKAIPQLNSFAPHERSMYYYADGESHFLLEQYKDAISYFELALTACYDNEKSDALYRIGLSYMFMGNWINARDYLQWSLAYYTKYRNTTDMKPRIAQIKNMITGCEEHFTNAERNQLIPFKEDKVDSTFSIKSDTIIIKARMDSIFHKIMDTLTISKDSPSFPTSLK